MDISWLEGAAKSIDRVGFAAVIVLLLLYAVWQVIKWLGKRADRVIVAHVRMTRTFARNDNKHTTALEMIAANDKQGHETTHHKLDVLREDVKRISGPPPGAA